jgi:hypothetical protein
MSSRSSEFFSDSLRAINVGVSSFADSLAAQGAGVAQVNWRPPAGGDREAARLLERLTSIEAKIEAANAKAIDLIVNGQPTWIDVMAARDFIPGFAPNMILHAGPPIADPDRIHKPLRTAICGAAIQEGWRRMRNGPG